MKGTDKLLKTYYFIVDQIVKRFGEDRKTDKLKLNIAFKAFYRREYDSSHTSLLDFEREELNELINRILIEFSVEYGIYLLQPNDPHNAEELSLSDYLVYKSWNMPQDDYKYLEAIKNLPEGYVPITNWKQLKKLKNGKKKEIPQNLTWRYGIYLYTYSPFSKEYYKRLFSPITPMDKLNNYIIRGVLYGPE